MSSIGILVEYIMVDEQYEKFTLFTPDDLPEKVVRMSFNPKLTLKNSISEEWSTHPFRAL